MKNRRYFGFARTLLVCLAAGVLFSACNSEPFQSDDDGDSVQMTLQAGPSDTRTTNNNNSTLWSEGDALSVIHSAAGGQAFYGSRFDFVSGNQFQGSVNRLSASNDWYAVYPYSAENVAANQIHLTFPARQTQTGNGSKQHLAGEGFPLYGTQKGVARSAKLGMSMKNLLSAAEFKVTNKTSGSLTVKEIVFTAQTAIVGKFQVDLTSEKPVFTAETGASKSVVLNVENGGAIAPQGEALFYAALAPFDVPVGGKLEYKVIAADASGKTTTFAYSVTLTTATSFSSGNIKPVKASLDADHAQGQGSGSGVAGQVELDPGDEPEDGDYLLVYDNGASSMAFAPFAEYASSKYAVPVTVVGGVVQPQEGQDLSVFAVTIENAGIKHPNDSQHDAYNVKNSAGQFIFYSSRGGVVDAALQIQDTNEVEIEGTTYQYYHTFVQEEDGVQIMSAIANSSGNKYLLAYSSANGFYYEESNTGQKLHLYLLGGSVKESRNLKFSPETVDYNVDDGGNFPEPELQGIYSSGTVTYSSNNTAVASVNAQTGVVTVHSAGTATITAEVEADDTYKYGKASYTINSYSSLGRTFYLVTELTAGEQYLIVSNGKALTNDGSSTTMAATTVTPANDQVTVTNADSMVWVATASGSGFTLTNSGKYVQRGSGSSGKPSINSAPSNTNYYIWTYDGSRLKTASGTTYYLYYSNNAWAQSSSSSAGTVSLYSATKPLTKQTLTFDKASVRWTVGEGGDHVLNQSYQLPQLVKGAQTTVTYTSENTSVATVTGTTVTIKKTGATTIIATAKEENGYKEATTSFTLRISEPIPGGFDDLGTFNLENEKVKGYLDEAEEKYTDDNYKSTSVVSKYTNNGRPSSRLDFPAPVKIEWSQASSGSTTITIYADQALEEVVWVQTVSSGTTSDEVYNLIPGKTYYCTVEDNNGYLLKGAFNTEGRRRMMRVSTTQSQSRANNCRDLGGMKTKDGTKRIKYGMIYRGTNLDQTKDKSISNYVSPNNSEQGLLANYMNVGYDIDLRAGGKSAFDTNKYDVKYVLGDMNPNLDDVTNTGKATTTLKGFFAAAAAGKASYFHCAIGSDRTGFWGLLIEGLLGVSAKDCSIDFELTGFAGNVTSGDRPRNSSGYLFYQGMGFFDGYTGDTLQQRITAYVKGLGFTDAEIQAFQDAVLEPIN